MIVEIVHVAADLSRIFCALLAIVAICGPPSLIARTIEPIVRAIRATDPDPEVKPPKK